MIAEGKQKTRRWVSYTCTVEDSNAALQEAISFATGAHLGQVDKCGKPYIEHPLRVMESVSEFGEGTMITAVLHDVVEDCSVNLADLGRLPFTTPEIVSAVGALSRREDESYWIYIERLLAWGSLMALRVKLADLRDNMLPERSYAGSESLYEKRYVPTLARVAEEIRRRREP